LKAEHPELGSAVDLQIGLAMLEHRVQSRVPLPWVEMKQDWIESRLAEGCPVLRFEHLPITWVDFRWLFREITALLRRSESLEDDDHREAEALVRAPERLELVVRGWFNATVAPELMAPDHVPAADMIQQIVLLAARPFLIRCAEAYGGRLNLTAWRRGICPLCGAEPDFGHVTSGGERLLICCRCTARWPFAVNACPFCGNGDAAHMTSFTSRDGIYRIEACDVCKRYVKAYDARRAVRPILPLVDGIATLPLDAAAQQKGYLG